MMDGKGIVCAAVLFSTLTMAVAEAQPLPIGSDFLVNTYTSYNQRRPAVSASPNGDFVVVWYSYGGLFLTDAQDGDAGGIFAQRYSSAGATLGTEFLVNTYTSFHQNYPAVATGPNGDFVVAWASATIPMLNGGSIRARRFASNGTPFGADFQVNTTVSFATRRRPMGRLITPAATPFQGWTAALAVHSYVRVRP